MSIHDKRGASALASVTIGAMALAACGRSAPASAPAKPATAAATATRAAAPLSAAQVVERYGLQGEDGCGSDASLGITACVTAYDPALAAPDGVSAQGVKVLVFADRASRDAWLADWTGQGQKAIAKGEWWLIVPS